MKDQVKSQKMTLDDILNRLNRDFLRRKVPNLDEAAAQQIKWIYDHMIPLTVKSTEELLYDGLLIDTCFLLRGKIPKDSKIIITDGVILEIIQGCIFEKKEGHQVDYHHDLNNLIQLKTNRGENCIFISLNSRSRVCYPTSNIKYGLRRNVDSELLNISLKIYLKGRKIQVATLDMRLANRYTRDHSEDVKDAIIYQPTAAISA